jgi:Bax protein
MSPDLRLRPSSGFLNNGGATQLPVLEVALQDKAALTRVRRATLRWRKYSIGLSLVALSVVGLYFLSQPEKGRTPRSGVSDRLAAKTDTVVEPRIKYSPAIVPKNMTVKEKKARFKALVVGSVDQVYQELDLRYRDVAAAIEAGTDRERIEKLKAEYRAKTDVGLLAALKPHPRSIALAQAAMESAWGTSRFFTQANNVFGVWSFNKNEPRIAAGKQRGGKRIWLKKYRSIYASVRDNYRILARGDAYKRFRALRLKTDNPYELVKKLDRYSEKGSAYGKELASVIRFNKLTRYDSTSYKRGK